MSDDIFSRMKKQFKRPLYKVIMVLFGLPTFLVGAISYLFYRKNSKADSVGYRKEATNQLQEEGVFEKIKAECRSLLENKFNFFGKNTAGHEFESSLKKQTDSEMEAEIQKKMDELMCTKGAVKPRGFIDYVTDGLKKNPLLLVLSIISSIPLYVLMIICLNYFTRYSFERIVMMVFVVFGVVWLVFTILHFSSFDAAQSILGDTATEDQIADFNRTYGLDKPYVTQLFTWFKRIVTFDLGNSYASKSSVLTVLARRFPTTLKLVAIAICIGFIIAIPLGIISSLKANSGIDYFAIFLALILMSMPSFWIGMILLLNLSIKAGWLPATFDTAKAVSYILPAFTLSFSLLAFTTRNTRSAMLEVSRQDYITTARAKGLSNGTVVMRHMFRNALIPIITAAGLQIGRMMGGSAVEERVYAVQGVGNYVTSAVYIPDIPVVITCVVYIAILVSIVNLIVDLLYAILDPGVKANLKKN